MIEQDILDLQNEVLQLKIDLDHARQELLDQVAVADQSLMISQASLQVDVASLRSAFASLTPPNNFTEEHITQTFTADDNAAMLMVMKWLRETMPSRYDYVRDYRTLTIMFDEKSDAMLFKLRWAGV